MLALIALSPQCNDFVSNQPPRTHSVVAEIGRIDRFCHGAGACVPSSRPIIGATDRSNVALHGSLQYLLGARFDDPFPVVAIDPIECERHQC